MALSEAEKTQMAILQAQGDTRRNDRSKEIEEARLTKQKQKQPQNGQGSKKRNADTDTQPSQPEDGLLDSDVIKKEFPYMVTLGKTKVVHFKPWTGRTKKEFNKLISDTNDIEDLNIDRTMKILIRDYIFEKDIYLSDIEYQYLLLRLRDESLSDECEYNSLCPECNHTKTINAKTSEVYRYIPSLYPRENEEIGVTYVDIISNSEFERQVETITSSKDYDGVTTGTDIEIAMHIQKGDKTPVEILDMIDGTTLKNLTKLMEHLRESAPSMEMYKEEECTNRECSMYLKKVKYYTDDIPDVFNELVG